MRLKQIRDVILSRQEREFRKQVGVEEAKLQHLVTAVYSAAGNKKGAGSAQRIRLLPKKKGAKEDLPTTEQVSRIFPATGDMYSQEEIEALAEKIRSGEIEVPM